MNDEGTPRGPRVTIPRPDAGRFFRSDDHLYHDNIIRLSGRPFRSVHHMNETLVANHNAVVRPGDVVFFMGDVVMGRGFEQNLEIIDRFNGYKILIPGNHDRCSRPWTRGNAQKRERWYQEYRRYFDVVLSDSIAWPITIGEFELRMSHYPYAGDSQELDRHKDMRPEDDGGLLLHGHVHEKWHTRGRMFNVGVDVNDFAPVSESTIIEWAKTTGVS